MPDVINVSTNAKNVKASKKQAPYTKVIIYVGNDENGAETAYIAGDDTGSTLEITNPFGTQEMANNILAKIYGVQYQPYSVETGLLDPSAELGDGVSTNNVYGGLYSISSYFGHQFNCDYSAPQEEQVDSEFKFTSPLERRVLRQENDSKAEFRILRNEIGAKVSQTGGDNSSFGWRLVSTGFTLFSGSKDVFSCDSNGAVIKGTVYADNGLFGGTYNSSTQTWSGGFHIASNKMYSGQSTYDGTAEGDVAGVYVGTDGIGLGKGSFYVTKAGVLTAKNANISGTINATSGKIGGDSGFTIQSQKIYNGTTSLSDETNAGIFLGTTGIHVYKDATHNFTLSTSTGGVKICNGLSSINDTSNTSGFFLSKDGLSIGGGKFKVTSAGKLTAETGTFKGTVYLGKLSYTDGNGNAVTINGSHLTGTSVEGGKIKNGAITYNKTDSNVKTFLDHGEAAHYAVTSLSAGTVECNTLRTNNLLVRYSGSVLRLASWHTIKDYNGDDHSILSYN